MSTVAFSPPATVNRASGIGLADWGPLVCGIDVDQAILQAVYDWAPTYLKHFVSERSLPHGMATPRQYTTTFAGQEFTDHKLPAVIAITAQCTATRGGSNRTYEATWMSRLATVLRAKNPPSTRIMASYYEGVFRRLVTQKARGGVLNDLHWVRAHYEEVPDATGAGRYTLAAISTFEIYTDQAVQPYAGPDVQDATTYLAEATVTEVDIEVLGSQLPPITSGP